MKSCWMIGSFVLMLVGCVSSGSSTESSVPKNKDSPVQEHQTTIYTAVGWVQSAHTEYVHTVIGFKTADGRLLNLIFPGMYQQLTPGLYCRITYYRVFDVKHLPGFLRKQNLNYYILEKAELLLEPDLQQPQKGERRKR